MARKFAGGWLEQYRIEKAIQLYVNEKGNLKEISEITGVTVRRIMGTLRKKNIPLRMGEGVFDTGMEHARRVIGFRWAWGVVWSIVSALTFTALLEKSVYHERIYNRSA